MKQLKKLIHSLNLIYYEYDKDKNLFIFDENYNNEHMKREFIKITYTLTKNNIPFDVINNQILLNKKLSFFGKIYKKIEHKIIDYKNSNKDIFLLNDNKLKWTKNIPVFKIEYLNEKIDLSNYDALVFTSKNAVIAIDKINKKWKEIPSYIIGIESAKKVKDLGGKISYISKTNNSKDFTQELKLLLKNKRTLYLRGEKINLEISKELLNCDIKCNEQIIYKNIFQKREENLPKNSKIIFSSPSSVKYFLKNFKWDKSFKAISIGKTTLASFPSYISPILAEKSSLKSCIKKAISVD